MRVSDLNATRSTRPLIGLRPLRNVLLAKGTCNSTLRFFMQNCCLMNERGDISRVGRVALLLKLIHIWRLASASSALESKLACSIVSGRESRVLFVPRPIDLSFSPVTLVRLATGDSRADIERLRPLISPQHTGRLAASVPERRQLNWLRIMIIIIGRRRKQTIG